MVDRKTLLREMWGQLRVWREQKLYESLDNRAKSVWKLAEKTEVTFIK